MSKTEKKLTGKKLAAVAIAAIIVVAAVVSVWWIYFRAPEAPSIKIGVIGPMKYVQGQHHKYGAVMAVEEINAKGGVLGLPLKLVIVDSEEMDRPYSADIAMERLLTKYNISLVVGGFRTEGVLRMQDVAMYRKTIFLGTGAADDELCKRVFLDYDTYKYWFRVTPVNSTTLAHVAFMGLGKFGERIKDQLGIETPKVAILAEKATWSEAIITAAKHLGAEWAGMEYEVVGTWRPSPTATDVTAELTAIKEAGANIIFTALSGPVGIAYAKQWGELEIPAASIGINVEAQKSGFWDATDEKGEYETTLNAVARTAITDLTIPWYDKFVDSFGEIPTYNAGTYEAIYLWAEAVERAGTLDSDAVVVELEKTGSVGGMQKFRDAPEGVTTVGRIVFTESHDVMWGPDYVTGMYTQWLDGELKCVWPMGEPEGWIDLTTADWTIPPWMTD